MNHGLSGGVAVSLLLLVLVTGCESRAQKEQIISLTSQVEQLQRENADLKRQVETLTKENADLTAQLETAKAQLEALAKKPSPPARKM